MKSCIIDTDQEFRKNSSATTYHRNHDTPSPPPKKKSSELLLQKVFCCCFGHGGGVLELVSGHIILSGSTFINIHKEFPLLTWLNSVTYTYSPKCMRVLTKLCLSVCPAQYTFTWRYLKSHKISTHNKRTGRTMRNLSFHLPLLSPFPITPFFYCIFFVCPSNIRNGEISLNNSKE